MFNITLSYYNGISKNCNYFFSIIKIKSFLCYENTAKSAYHRSPADMREHSAYIKKGLPRMRKKLSNLMHIAKSYGDNVILDDLNLYIRENEFITLLGPSGCGKTTTLRIIGGFETPDKGQVLFDGKDITALPPNERDLNTVFQKYALFPHMSIAENIAFGLKIRKKSKAYIDDKIKYALKLVNLDGFEHRSIDSLSGGQQQRIAIARAIVNEPRVLLLDEPLGALDLKLRQEMQYELIRLKNELGITFVFVTHDQEEALTMSDTIVVMNQGYIQQIGTPEMIYPSVIHLKPCPTPPAARYSTC